MAGSSYHANLPASPLSLDPDTAHSLTDTHDPKGLSGAFVALFDLALSPTSPDGSLALETGLGLQEFSAAG